MAHITPAPSVIVSFTKGESYDTYMKQVDIVKEMCKDIIVYDFYQGKELENEERFISEIPRQMLKISYDLVLKDLHHCPKKIISKSSFRGINYEIIVILRY